MKQSKFKRIAMLLLLIATATLTMSSACSRDEDDTQGGQSRNEADYPTLIVGKWGPTRVFQTETYEDGHTQTIDTSCTVSATNYWEFKSNGSVIFVEDGVVDDNSGMFRYTVTGNRLTLIALFVPLSIDIVELTRNRLVLQFTYDEMNPWLYNMSRAFSDGNDDDIVTGVSRIEYARIS